MDENKIPNPWNKVGNVIFQNPKRMDDVDAKDTTK